jgi:hypothetical protein
MATERSEREFLQDVNAAIAGTEDEIFRDALEDDLDDNDGDRSLEEMGDGLEGDPLDEDDIEVEEDIGPEKDEKEDEDDEEAEEASGEEEDEEAEDDQPTRDQRGRFDRQKPNIPPSRLREESERARQAEQREQDAIRRLEIMEARFNDMQARLNVPPPAKTDKQEPAPKPDMFAEPEKYEQWVLDQAEQRAAQRFNAQFAERDRQAQERQNARVDDSLNTAARGDRGWEFQAAYSRLTSLDPKNPADRATVQRIYGAPDPATALFDWWDQNGGEQYREHVISQLMPRQRGEPRGERRQVQQPRHEIRQPQRIMRSLNSASGSNSSRVSDPDMLDGSESSVFEYATKR